VQTLELPTFTARRWFIRGRGGGHDIEKGDSLRIYQDGRTHLMDAMPVRLDQTFSCVGGSTARQYRQPHVFRESKTTQLAQGGTAVGTGH